MRARPIVLLAVIALAAGCTSGGYNTPPTALGSRPLRVAVPGEAQLVVVVGDFADPPTSSVRLRGVGPGVSEAMRQALLNDGGFDVWSNRGLARAVQSILDGPTPQRTERLGRLAEEHEAVRFVITGRVTDFHHTGEVAPEVRRHTFFGKQRAEAIVAIQFEVVDLAARRVIVADHVHGTAETGDRSAREIYRELAFGSYLFWNAPLGRATESAIRTAMARIGHIVPAVTEPVRIVSHSGPRRVHIAGPGAADLRPGDEFVVVCYDPRRSTWSAIEDPHTGQVVRARIASTEGEAILLGLPPAEVSIRGAELRLSAPPKPASAPEPTPEVAAVDENADPEP